MTVITRYTIMSMATALLDAGPIQGEGELTKQAKLAYRTYEIYRNDLLSQKDWYWTTVDFELSRLDEAPTDKNWSYQFTLPGDLKRIIKVYDFAQQERLDYALQDRKLLRNMPRMKLLYVRNVPEAKFPEWFVTALAAFLAFQWCPSLRGSRDKYTERERDMNNKIRRAEHIDNLNKPPQYLYGRSVWLDAREVGPSFVIQG